MSTPYRLWEIQERSNTGPPCDEDEFLPKVFTPKLQEIIEKYEIRYDPKTPVPADDGLADRVWQAGWELFREVGLYNTDTHRVIKVSDDELREALYMSSDRYRGQGAALLSVQPRLYLLRGTPLLDVSGIPEGTPPGRLLCPDS
ncbi:MAG: monomethylamine:corrinoid methyltransferase [Deltaproteobacteria bacterium]|nr:monomethylamine:corrinoid methyltransferase [Deltaproteobacteria bacterium]